MTQAPLPTISVIITCYNYGNYIHYCLDSVLAQTYTDFEIIVVDDGSTDNTPDVMTRYQRSKNIHYVRQKNAGQANAKNRGITEAKGDYIAFLDADDIWKMDKLEKQIKLFDKQSVGVVFSRSSYMDKNGKKLNFAVTGKYLQPRSGIVSKWLFLDNFVPFSSSVVRRECFETLGGFDKSIPMGIDWDMWLRFSTKYEFAFVDEPLLIYRIGHPGQMSKNLSTRQKCADRIMAEFLNRFPGMIDKNTIDEAYYYTCCNRAIHYSDVDKVIAFKYLSKAIRLKPFDSRAYKRAIKCLLR